MRTKTLLLLALVAPGALASDHLVLLKNKAFVPEILNIKVGDSVNFRNEDVFDHSVSSESETKKFDLDTLPNGETRKVTFDKPGKVEVDCGHHSAMHLTIDVSR